MQAIATLNVRGHLIGNFIRSLSVRAICWGMRRRLIGFTFLLVGWRMLWCCLTILLIVIDINIVATLSRHWITLNVRLKTRSRSSTVIFQYSVTPLPFPNSRKFLFALFRFLRWLTNIFLCFLLLLLVFLLGFATRLSVILIQCHWGVR